MMHIKFMIPSRFNTPGILLKFQERGRNSLPGWCETMPPVADIKQVGACFESCLEHSFNDFIVVVSLFAYMAVHFAR